MKSGQGPVETGRAFVVTGCRPLAAFGGRVEEKVAAFLRYLSAERGASPRTLRNYRIDLLQFFRFLQETGLAVSGDGSLDLGTVDHVTIRAFLATLQKKGLSRPSQARKLATLRSFFRYLSRQGEVAGNPARPVSSPKLPKRLAPYLEVDETFRLLESLRGEDPITTRDRAVLELLYASGIRVGELVTLDLQDLDLQAGLVKVKGKGGRERIVPIGRKAIAALEDYLKLRHTFIVRSSAMKEPKASRSVPDVPNLESPTSNDASALFFNTRGRRLQERSVRAILSHYLQKSGLGRRITPHGLRHSFATHLLSAGANLRAIQELLGHRRLSTTQRYTAMSPEQLMEVYDRTHPRA